MNRRLERVNVASLRVALISTGLVAAVYAVVALLVVVFVTNNLTAQVDSRLASSLKLYEHHLPRFPTTGGVSDTGQGGLDSPALIWVIFPPGVLPTGTQLTTIGDRTALPAADTGITGPTTTKVEGVDVRIVGTSLGIVGMDTGSGTVNGPARLVVGYNVDSVAQARSSLIVTEGFAGVILLLLVFGGTLVVGRRVGAPIELARQRQLEFTADASHELRTPLAVIEAQTSLALSQDRDPVWYRNAFQRVGSESKRIRRLVDDFSAFAKLPKVEPLPVDLGQVVDDFARAHPEWQEALQVDRHAPVEALCDRMLVRRVLANLVENAVQAAAAAGKKPLVRLAVALDASGRQACLTVDDNGPGVDAPSRDRIFDPYVTTKEHGTGLGLAIVRKIVLDHGGDIRLTDAPAPLGGARFVVTLPALPGAGPTAPPRATPGGRRIP